MPSGSPQLVSIKNPPILSPENERNLLSGFLRHLPHSSKSTIKLSMPQVKPAPILSLPSNHSHTESWGTPHLLLGQPEPIVPVEVTTPSNNPITPIHSAPIEAPAHAPFPSTPPSATHRSAPMFIPSIHPRTRPETLAHKMAWGWVDTIIHFLKINRDRAQQPPTAVQQAFRSMLATVAELDEQKNLISFDVISSTGLYTVVKALANAGVRAQKARPSEQAAGVVACWERRFPGRLSDAEGGMEVDG
ncbi:hypothetical protein L226DRAFT_571250 [Lentinus tigrinus ALCF2SS1-7]|uniref:Uncharacterized protein n=1 Tax=Lentinus tigrinus ALCF2SS1-6 TaxID=1328759 RepID=A0A5C2SDH1_9APHY|nr:hypothetical protein L227DRAFT_652028 [Lentinus tigrinus ALCF2SS1-6]RPD74335.1 hypothetical protein L226DRAFT_571250 [Lentinus tigrinus ALCF2SS1-7]